MENNDHLPSEATGQSAGAQLHQILLGKSCGSALFLLFASIVFPWAVIGRGDAIVSVAWVTLFVLGFMIFYTGVHGSRLAFASRKWSRNMAKVISVGHETQLHKGKQRYRPKITYSFTFGGISYTGDTLDFSTDYTSRARSDAWAARLVSGDHVMISVDAGNPDRNVIEPGIRLVQWVQLLAGLAGMAVPLLTFAGLINWS